MSTLHVCYAFNNYYINSQLSMTGGAALLHHFQQKLRVVMPYPPPSVLLCFK